MPIVKSKHDSRIAYGDPADPVYREHLAKADSKFKPTAPVTLEPGDNVVTDEQVEALRADPNFARHHGAGKMSVHADPVAADEHVVEDDSTDPVKAVAKLRKQAKDEKKADFEKRITGYGAFLTDWFASSPEDRAVLEASLTDEQKLLIVADPRSAPSQE